MPTHPYMTQARPPGARTRAAALFLVFWERTTSAAAMREGDLIEHRRPQLATWRCPTFVELRDELPVSASGTLLTNVLRPEPQRAAS